MAQTDLMICKVCLVINIYINDLPVNIASSIHFIGIIGGTAGGLLNNRPNLPRDGKILHLLSILFYISGNIWAFGIPNELKGLAIGYQLTHSLSRPCQWKPRRYSE